MNLIKVLNPEKANELASLGFKYTTETLGEKSVYVFIQSDELTKNIQQNFSKNEYFIDRTMNF